MWSNGIKCKYMFMFHLKNLARKGLTLYMVSTGFQKKIQALFKDFFKDIFAVFKDIFRFVPGISQ